MDQWRDDIRESMHFAHALPFDHYNKSARYFERSQKMMIGRVLLRLMERGQLLKSIYHMFGISHSTAVRYVQRAR